MLTYQSASAAFAFDVAFVASSSDTAVVAVVVASVVCAVEEHQMPMRGH